MKPSHALWKDLAGPAYDELMRSKDDALARLADADRIVRIVAINICNFVWNCSRDAAFVTACRTMAATDPDPSVRAHAVASLGRSFGGTRDSTASRFLAGIARGDEGTPEAVRSEAYWALRAVQFGCNDEEELKHSVSVVKKALNNNPSGMLDAHFERLLEFAVARHPNVDWDSIDNIDLDFVDKYA